MKDCKYEVLVTRTEHPLSTPAREVEEEVFFEAFGNTPELLEEEYSQYENISVFVTVYEKATNLAVASSRLLIAEPSKLKSVQDLTKEPWSKNLNDLNCDEVFKAKKVVDVATLGVVASSRGQLSSGTVSMALYHGVLRTIQALEIDMMVAVFDLKVYKMINRIFNNAWKEYEGVPAKEYLGSPLSIPSYCSSEELKALAKEKKPGLYESIYGNDTKGEVSYPSWDEISEYLKDFKA